MVPGNLHRERECPECGSRLTWHPYGFTLDVYGGGKSYGRWWCHNYGGCELAPG